MRPAHMGAVGRCVEHFAFDDIAVRHRIHNGQRRVGLDAARHAWSWRPDAGERSLAMRRKMPCRIGGTSRTRPTRSVRKPGRIKRIPASATRTPPPTFANRSPGSRTVRAIRASAFWPCARRIIPPSTPVPSTTASVGNRPIAPPTVTNSEISTRISSRTAQNQRHIRPFTRVSPRCLHPVMDLTHPSPYISTSLVWTNPGSFGPDLPSVGAAMNNSIIQLIVLASHRGLSDREAAFGARHPRRL